MRSESSFGHSSQLSDPVTVPHPYEICVLIYNRDNNVTNLESPFDVDSEKLKSLLRYEPGCPGLLMEMSGLPYFFNREEAKALRNQFELEKNKAKALECLTVSKKFKKEHEMISIE